MNARTLISVVVLGLATNGCTEWQRNVTLNGVPFCRATVRDDGFVLGLLSRETVVQGRPCAPGWLHLHANGVPAAFTSAQPIVLGSSVLPSGTWIRQDARGTIQFCAFPEATAIQGQACRGTGGPKGVTTAFYASGALKTFFPVRAVVIDGVPCRGGLLNGWIALHENGRLQSGVLDADLERDGRRYRRGERVEFDAEGRVTRRSEPVLDTFTVGA